MTQQRKENQVAQQPKENKEVSLPKTDRELWMQSRVAAQTEMKLMLPTALVPSRIEDKPFLKQQRTPEKPDGKHESVAPQSDSEC
jgi:hypothetical protein